MNTKQELAEAIIEAEGNVDGAIEALAEVMAQMQDEEHGFGLSDDEYEKALKEATEHLEGIKDEAVLLAEELAEQTSQDIYDMVKDMEGEY